ncbi:hypothetical protein WR25_10121 isoform A [Diploscapter pachys]|uniref:Uncharacterized protein n=1 Tax=Diploscapter pachys TaxID=2018661 RepID=A0A2A2LE83_9BILA|nr:hypothetical protein WR25_10121 isoform A [Diploscapter pachys]
MSWLRNFGDQLQNFANEVLAEVTQEPELQERPEKFSDFQLKLPEFQEIVPELELQKAISSESNEELLQAILEEKKNLIVEKYKLEAMIRHRNNSDNANKSLLSVDLNDDDESHSQKDEMKEQLKSAEVELEKKDKELQRLREHLIQVEDTYIKEAIEAEEREKSLRDLVAELQKIHNVTATGATESSQMYEEKVAELREKFEFAEKAANSWKSQFETEKQLHDQITEALRSLQSVVHEISTENEKESALTAHREMELHEELKNQAGEIRHLNAQLEKIGLDKQALEDEIERVKEKMKKAEAMIHELEEQNASLCASRKDEEKTKKNGFKIDDEVLRQIKAAFRYSIIPSSTPLGAPLSLADQFVRFLENESISSENAPSLPAPTEPAKIKEPGTEQSRQHSPKNIATSDSDTGSHISEVPLPGHVLEESTVAALDEMLR